jgi:hypothetical protein
MKHKWEKKERKHPNRRKTERWAECANCGLAKWADWPLGMVYWGNGEMFTKAPICEMGKYKKS